jgi:hypothetical protein
MAYLETAVKRSPGRDGMVVRRTERVVDPLKRKQLKRNSELRRQLVRSPSTPGSDPPLVLAYQALVRCFKDYGLVTPARLERERILHHWTTLSADCGWLKFLKYKLGAWRAWALSLASDEKQEDVPRGPGYETDKPHYLLGRTGLLSFYRLRDWARRAPCDHVTLYSFIDSINAVKGALPLPTADHLMKAEETTYQALTTPRAPVAPILLSFERAACDLDHSSVNFSADGQSGQTLRFVSVCPATIKEQIRRTIREVFRNCKKFEQSSDLYMHRMPSIKATYDNSCVKGGTLGNLTRLGLFHRSDRVLGTFPNPDSVIRTPLQGLDSDLEVGEGLLFETRWRQFVGSAAVEAMQEADEVTLLGLAEALKCRVISKGPGLKYFTLKPVQKFMHDIMRHHPVFQLIGRPCDAYVLDEQILAKRGCGRYFLSGDYAEATNRIRSDYSQFCGEQVLEAIGVPVDSFLHSMFLKCLCGSQISTKRSPSKPQVEGQLMGSIVSFPILCLINAAVCRWSMEITGNERISLAKAPLLVNGDDCLFTGDRNLFSVWEKVANQVGLEKSLGKTYFSKSFCSINSRTYVLPGGSFARGFLPVPYVNYRLLAGNSRSGSCKGFSINSLVDSADPCANLGARQTSLLEEAPLFLEERLTLRFLEVNNEKGALSSEMSRSVPIYLPRAQGGLGFTRPCVLEVVETSPSDTGLLIKPSLKFRDPHWVANLLEEFARSAVPVAFPMVPPPDIYGAVHAKVVKMFNLSQHLRWSWGHPSVENGCDMLSLYLYGMMFSGNTISTPELQSAKRDFQLRNIRTFWDRQLRRAQILCPDIMVRRPSTQRPLGGWVRKTTIKMPLTGPSSSGNTIWLRLAEPSWLCDVVHAIPNWL